MKDLIKDHVDEWRMYGLVPYNISSIQKGIQFGHAVQEYNNMIFDVLKAKKLTKSKADLISSFDNWRLSGKTFIVLNGGTTNSRIIDEKPFGSLNQHLNTLEGLEVKCAVFYEPDLGEQLTAVVFLVHEKVFNKRKYPNFEDWILESQNFENFIINTENEEEFPKDAYDCWKEFVGGESNIKLREFLSQFNFA